MKKETDLDCIKSTAKTFLYLDINRPMVRFWLASVYEFRNGVFSK